MQGFGGLLGQGGAGGQPGGGGLAPGGAVATAGFPPMPASAGLQMPGLQPQGAQLGKAPQPQAFAQHPQALQQQQQQWEMLLLQGGIGAPPGVPTTKADLANLAQALSLLGVPTAAPGVPPQGAPPPPQHTQQHTQHQQQAQQQQAGMAGLQNALAGLGGMPGLPGGSQQLFGSAFQPSLMPQPPAQQQQQLLQQQALQQQALQQQAMQQQQQQQQQGGGQQGGISLLQRLMSQQQQQQQQPAAPPPAQPPLQAQQAPPAQQQQAAAPQAPSVAGTLQSREQELLASLQQLSELVQLVGPQGRAGAPASALAQLAQPFDPASLLRQQQQDQQQQQQAGAVRPPAGTGWPQPAVPTTAAPAAAMPAAAAAPAAAPAAAAPAAGRQKSPAAAGGDAPKSRTRRRKPGADSKPAAAAAAAADPPMKAPPAKSPTAQQAAAAAVAAAPAPIPRVQMAPVQHAVPTLQGLLAVPPMQAAPPVLPMGAAVSPRLGMVGVKRPLDEQSANLLEAATAAVAGGAQGPSAAGGFGELSEADKVEEARRKNREAQQRFRERQRAAVREAEAQYNQMLEEVERLRLENDHLEERNRVMTNALAVRDAMLQAFSLGQPTGSTSEGSGAAGNGTMRVRILQPAPAGQAGQPAAGEQQPGDGSNGHAASPGAAAAGEGAADGSGPSDMEAAGQEGGGSGAGQADGSGDPPAAGGAAAAAAAGGAGTELGDASVGGSRGLGSSTEIEEVHPASHGAIINPAAVKLARELVSPEDYTAYYQQFQVEMQYAVQMWRDNGMTQEDEEAVAKAHADIQAVWANMIQIYPKNFKVFVQEMAAPDGTQSDRWEAFAATLRVPADKLLALHKAYRKHVRQVHRIWQERQVLRHQLDKLLKAAERTAADTAAGGGRFCLHSAAAHLLEVLQVQQGLDALAEEEYGEILALAMPMTTAIGQFGMGLANAESAPFLPNWLEIVRRLLRRAAESGKLSSSAGGQLTHEELDELSDQQPQFQQQQRSEVEELLPSPVLMHGGMAPAATAAAAARGAAGR